MQMNVEVEVRGLNGPYIKYTSRFRGHMVRQICLDTELREIHYFQETYNHQKFIKCRSMIVPWKFWIVFQIHPESS